MALKFYKADRRFKEYARGEVEILEKVEAVRRESAGVLPGSDCVVRMWHYFEQQCANCSHPCLAMEVLGPSALELAQRCRGDCLPSSAVFALARDTLSGLRFLHDACRIIHTDIKPENILARIPPSSPGRCSRGTKRQCSESVRRRHPRARADAVLSNGDLSFCIADLGNSCFADRHVSDFIQTCEYKSPEVLLGAGYNGNADVWSFACVVYECATGRYLFDPRCVYPRPVRPSRQAAADGGAVQTGTDAVVDTGGNHAPAPEAGTCTRASGDHLEEEHLAQISALVGPLPESLLQRGKLTGQLLVSTGSVWQLRSSGEALLQRPISDVATRLRERHLPGEVADVVDMVMYIQRLSRFLVPALAPDPADRVSAAALLQGSPWLLRNGYDA